MPYIISTLPNSQKYTEYRPARPKDYTKEIARSVLVNGGSGVANIKTLLTPLGVVTKVTDDELEFLQRNRCFKEHVAKGFIKIQKTTVNPEKVAADMVTRDKSSPLVPGDFKKEKDTDAMPVEGEKKKAKGK